MIIQQIKISCFLFFCCLKLYVFSQLLPVHGSILNYNQVLFQTEPVKNSLYYEFVISEDFYFEKKDSFSNKTVVKKIDSTNVTILDDLRFGAAYKWKVLAYDNVGKICNESGIFTFSIMPCDYCDSKKYVVLQNYNEPEKYSSGIIWCDLYHCAVDRNGKVVWQFPIISKGIEKGRALRDLHMYPTGDLTFITDTNIFCIDKDLIVKWKINNSNEQLYKHYANYHHCFKKLQNNHFMVLKARPFFIALSSDTTNKIRFDDDYLVEYDENGKVVWSWYTSDHFNLDLIKQLALKTNKNSVSLHLNSFSIDSVGKYIYLSFRDLNRIIKIERRTKKIVAEYGRKLSELDTMVFETNLFSKQHDVRVIGSNEITLFNNNSIDSNYISSALRIKLPSTKAESYSVQWEFKLNFDSLTNGKADRLGSVELLSNGNYLICTGENGRLLEVTNENNVVWDLMLFEKVTNPNRLLKFPQYKIAFNTSLYPYHFFAYSRDRSIYISNEGSEEDEFYLFLKKSKRSKHLKQVGSLKLFPYKFIKLSTDNYRGYALIIKSKNSLATKELILIN